MPKSQNKQVGRIGEELSIEFLKNKGYQILERNWGNKWGEIDIIARDKETIVFVEVKTKVGITFGTPEEMVNKKKLAQIERLASIYPLTQNSQLRIDIIAIILSDDLSLQSIKHYQSVY